MRTPKRMFIATTKSRGPIGALIRLMTIPISWLLRMKLSEVPTHALIGFEYDGGERYYFESLDTAGFSGPKSFDKLLKYAANEPTYIYWLDVPVEAMERIQAECFSKREVWTYGTAQIGQLAKWNIMSRMMRKAGYEIPQSQNQVTCSEAVSRLVYPDYNVPKMINLPSDDYVAPVHLSIFAERLGIEPEKL